MTTRRRSPRRRRRGQALVEFAMVAPMFFLVLFSYSFFLKGVTGLTVAIGSVA